MRNVISIVAAIVAVIGAIASVLLVISNGCIYAANGGTTESYKHFLETLIDGSRTTKEEVVEDRKPVAKKSYGFNW